MRTILAATLIFTAAACSKPTELASDDNAVGGPSPMAPASVPSIPPPDVVAPPLEDPSITDPPAVDPEVREAFPDYQPKTTPDTVLDYRPAVSGDIAALPADAAELAEAFVSWKAKASAAPGAFEQGAQHLGADEQQYVPSDAELVAAAAGARLARALSGADEATKEAVAAVLGPDPATRTYKRFDFRHVDVLGSGRFFYASPPKDASIPT
jgi:hypothetical protein